MAKSSNAEKVRRINAALRFIKREGSAARAAELLASQYGVSRSQAYRYVQAAQTAGKEVVVPGTKIAFTVKLSQRLIEEVRQRAQARGESISDIVTQALETFLYKGRQGGQKRGRDQADRT